MKKLILILLLLSGMVMPVSAAELTAPNAPPSAEELMPPDTENFAEGLLYVFRGAVEKLRPELASAMKICLSIIVVCVIVSVVSSLSATSRSMTELAGAIAVACLLLGNANTLISNAVETVTELSEYGKLLLPVMTAALAAQGGVTSSAAIYAATAFFDAVLCGLIARVIVPLIYIYIAISVAASAIDENVLQKLKGFSKWLASWGLKAVLYIFTGYITITGVVSGAADQTALKATKLTISSMVPVVGGIMSDASEAVLVSAGLLKNAAGIYGLLAVAAIAIGPVLHIGLQYLLLKLTAAVCGVFAGKKITGLIEDFYGAMGLLLGMTCAMCLILMISTVCFLKGVGV
jgi:stage III sporulation protein AE